MQGCSQRAIVPRIVPERATLRAELQQLLSYLHVVFMLVLVTPKDALEKAARFISGQNLRVLHSGAFPLRCRRGGEPQAAHDGALAAAQAGLGRALGSLEGTGRQLILAEESRGRQGPRGEGEEGEGKTQGVKRRKTRNCRRAARPCVRCPCAVCPACQGCWAAGDAHPVSRVLPCPPVSPMPHTARGGWCPPCGAIGGRAPPLVSGSPHSPLGKGEGPPSSLGPPQLPRPPHPCAVQLRPSQLCVEIAAQSLGPIKGKWKCPS